MLRHKLIHPRINEVLGRAGHHAKILIADGNYPASSKKGPQAEVVCLNLMPGVVTCAQILEAVLSAVAIEEINTMMYEKSGPYALKDDPPGCGEYKKVIAAARVGLELRPSEQWDIYKGGETNEHVMTIQSGDQQRCSNTWLRDGVR